MAWANGTPFMPNTTESLLIPAYERSLLFAELHACGKLPAAGNKISGLIRGDNEYGKEVMKVLSPFFAKCDDESDDSVLEVE